MPIDKTIDYSEATPYICELSHKCIENAYIDPALYTKYDVKRGLRDLNGNGVLTGLTEISDIVAFEMKDGVKTPCEGRLYYRGVNVRDIVRGFVTEKRFGFEEVVYLLLFGELPKAPELEKFRAQLSAYRALPTNFVRDVIMKAPSADMMNTLARSVLTLYGYDARADDNAPENVLRQCLQLIALFPMLSVYGYQAYNHYVCGNSLVIHNPVPELSTAENFLHILRPDSRYTALEASVLDLALVLHAEHGGANVKVVRMFDDMKQHLTDWKDEEAVSNYLHKLLNKQAFDKAGLIYGMGHAVYSLSDPRADIFRAFVKSLAQEKGKLDEYELYSSVERLAPKVIAQERRIYKGVAANVDFYSGFVYSMLDLPHELYTPIFASSRIAGWSAHRLEELASGGKIIRPAYKCVQPEMPYVPLNQR